MSKADYFKELNYRLRGLPEKERQNILAVYEELFQKALENGKHESDVAQSLGYPRVPNWDQVKPSSSPAPVEASQAEAPLRTHVASEDQAAFQPEAVDAPYVKAEPVPAASTEVPLPPRPEAPAFNPEPQPQSSRSWEPPPVYTQPYPPGGESVHRSAFPSYTPPYPYPVKQDSSIKSIIISIMLGFFNLLFVVGPWFGVCAALIALFFSGFALLVAPVIGFLTGLANTAGNDLVFLMFAMLACFGLGVILTAISSWLIKLFFKITWKYIQFNAKLIKGA